MLFLYVGTDGPAMHRTSPAALDSSIAFDINNAKYCFKVNNLPLDQVFSIKYVAAFTASGFAAGGATLRDATSEVKSLNQPGGGVAAARRYYTKHWTFRETYESPVGTLNAAKDAAEAIFISAYHRNGSGYFSGELDVAVGLKPKYLILTAWNEFGSSSDEPNPGEAFTIMPSNKHGRGFSEILRSKVIQYKAP